MTKKLIAVCACPMGLAHTFMAAQALEEAAVEAGYEVKIEPRALMVFKTVSRRRTLPKRR